MFFAPSPCFSLFSHAKSFRTLFFSILFTYPYYYTLKLVLTLTHTLAGTDSSRQARETSSRQLARGLSLSLCLASLFPSALRRILSSSYTFAACQSAWLASSLAMSGRWAAAVQAAARRPLRPLTQRLCLVALGRPVTATHSHAAHTLSSTIERQAQDAADRAVARLQAASTAASPSGGPSVSGPSPSPTSPSPPASQCAWIPLLSLVSVPLYIPTFMLLVAVSLP